MKAKRVIHPGYKEFNEAKQNIPEAKLKQMFGKYQYLYSDDKGNEISLIKLKRDYCGKDIWEIFCIEGKVFEDTEQFNTKKEAVKRIKQLIN